MSASTALQLLRDQGKVKPGQKVLINGASGGVGTFAVQIAKAFGAEVTGVCSTGNVDMVRAIGADHVIDYTREDFTKGGPRYDFILDNVGNHSPSETRRALTPTGRLQPNGGGHSGGAMGPVIRALVSSIFVRQQLRPSVKFQNLRDLMALKELIEAGKVTPVIDGTYATERGAPRRSPMSETDTLEERSSSASRRRRSPRRRLRPRRCPSAASHEPARLDPALTEDPEARR